MRLSLIVLGVQCTAPPAPRKTAMRASALLILDSCLDTTRISRNEVEHGSGLGAF